MKGAIAHEYVQMGRWPRGFAVAHVLESQPPDADIADRTQLVGVKGKSPLSNSITRNIYFLSCFSCGMGVYSG